MQKNKLFSTLCLFMMPLMTQAALDDIKYLQFRIGHPYITLGPANNIIDGSHNSIKLTNGTYLCFTDNETSYRMIGKDPTCAGSSLTPVIGRVANGYSDCGLWIDNVERDPKNPQHLYAFTHAESFCNYDIGQSYKSFALVQSYDEGQTWALDGQIITGTQPPIPGRITGEGDCSEAADANYYYLYCTRNTDYKTFVARAAKDCDPVGGTWIKYNNGKWDSPGLGGAATGYSVWGTPSWWKDKDYMVLMASPSGASGSKIAFSQDRVNFITMQEPLLLSDNNTWNRTADAGDFVAYIVIQGMEGGRQWSNGKFQLAYLYIPPGGNFGQRYQVFRDVTLTTDTIPNNNGERAQVGVELSRFSKVVNGITELWTTNVPAPGYTYVKSLGYTMTRKPVGATAPATVAIEDCISNWNGATDHLISVDGVCAKAGYKRQRTLGWIYTTPQANTTALYRCWSPNKYKTHFASTDSACEGETAEFILGYIMTK
ncbi:Uncharacterised protein [Legionella beliardensis]|uniref:Secreted protein n=1 Tax=Legionella beliardensis TaxID=91822 RepID=A0A378HZD5_9GAMM|nr:hypothetical protein [Legionella beliardensis]STX28298.1 Uncharacterised protein [Legionella beliardensis]